MIVDNIKNAQLYFGLGTKFEKALKYIQANDLKSFENGKYEIDGDDIFIIIQDYNSKKMGEALFEAHKKYSDIQYIIEGEEQLGYANIEDFTPTTSYNEEKDLVFGNAQGSFIKAKEGDFIVFTPQDAHMPSMSIDKPSLVKKAVIKIKA